MLSCIGQVEEDLWRKTNGLGQSSAAKVHAISVPGHDRRNRLGEYGVPWIGNDKREPMSAIYDLQIHHIQDSELHFEWSEPLKLVVDFSVSLRDRFAKSLRTPVFRDISTLAAWKQTPSDTLKYIGDDWNTHTHTHRY